MMKTILCRSLTCGHEIDEHTVGGGCQTVVRIEMPSKKNPYGLWKVCACVLSPNAVAHDLIFADPTPTQIEAESRARWQVESKHPIHGTQCLCGFQSHVARHRTEHIIDELLDALKAAKEARR